MVLTMNGDLQRQRAAMEGRPLKSESDTRRDLERMHLQTIRREKIRLQQELERVRVKGQYIVGRKHMKSTSKNARLLSERLGKSSSDLNIGRRTRLDVGATDIRSVSPQNARISSAGPVHKDRELPPIGLTPLTAEVEMRRHHDELRDPSTKLNELKMNQGKQQNLLSLKVDQFTRSLTPVTSSRSPASSSALTPTMQESKATFVDETEVCSSGSDSRGSRQGGDVDMRASFPPQAKTKWRRASIADHDVKDAKQSVAKRLLPVEYEHADINGDIAAAVPSPSPTRRPTIIRKQSQVAILERTEGKVNKYAPVADLTQNASPDPAFSRRNLEAELSVSILGRDAKRVKEIIENPGIMFDQHKYAPDGALRTVHMLPNVDDAYSQARQARYLRWRDPKELEREHELSISNIFAKDAK